MTQRNKLEIQINKPTTIELLYDEPIIGASRYGQYFMYAVSVDGEEFSYFAPEEVHDKLKDFGKGDRAIITKLAAQRGSKLVTVYEVRPETKRVPQQSNAVSEVEPNDVEVTDDTTIEKEESQDISPADNFYEVMLQCYNDAQRIQHELNGFGDAEKIAVTLFIARTKNNYH